MPQTIGVDDLYFVKIKKLLDHQDFQNLLKCNYMASFCILEDELVCLIYIVYT